MSLQTLGLESLAALDPKVAETFRRHLKRAADDARDRPEDKTARKVVMEVLIAPVFRDGLCEDAEIQIKVTSAVPKHQSRVYSAALKPSGALLFNPDSPDAVDQAMFLDRDEE